MRKRNPDDACQKLLVYKKLENKVDIFILRHFESVKNTAVTFSSIDDMEKLTEDGIAQGREVASNLKNILDYYDLTVRNIYCADSVRAKESASIIAEGLSTDIHVRSYKALLSTKSKITMGRTKKDVWRSNPQFMRELSLYDAGLFNSYNFHRDVDEKMKREYEQGVCGCLEDILCGGRDENAKIICLHNSSLTAAVISFARKLCGYPESFYGKILADNGKIFWIRVMDSGAEFMAANCEAGLLSDMIRGGFYDD